MLLFFFQTDIMAVMTKQGKENRSVGEYRQQKRQDKLHWEGKLSDVC